MRNHLRFTAALAGLPLLALGCGGQAAGDDGTGPIKIGVMAGVQTNAISHPWIPQAAKIAAEAINDRGGIQGRKVEIEFCDDHGTPQGAAVCAQKLLMEEKVLMTVGNDGKMEPSLLPTLKPAKTISWATQAASVDSLKNDRSYVLQPVLAQYWILPQMLPDSTRRVAYISNDTVIARQGQKESTKHYPPSISITPLTVTATATDFQPTCLKIQQADADAAVVAVNPAQIPSILQTCHQIGLTKLLWAIPSIEMTPQVLKTVTELKTPHFTVQAYGKPAVERFAADVAAYGEKVGGITNTVADSAINAWLGVTLLEKIIPAAGGADGEKIKAWLDKQTAFDTGGATAPIDFTAEPVPAMPRVKNLSASRGEIKDGKIVVTDTKPYVAKINP